MVEHPGSESPGIRGFAASASLKPNPMRERCEAVARIRGFAASASLKPTLYAYATR